MLPPKTTSYQYWALKLANRRKRRRFGLNWPIGAIINYEKNVYEPLTDEQREEIAREWKIGFDEWGYRTI